MSQSSSSQTDPIRAADAQRATEMMLSSSVASSVNSLASQHSVVSMQGYARPHPGEGLPFMYPPSYSSQPPPSYGSYMRYPGPGHGNHIPYPNIQRHGMLSPQEPQQGPSNRHQTVEPQAGHAPQAPGLPYNPQSYQHRMQMPPHMSHLQYSSGGGGYGSLPFPVIMTDDLVSGTQHGGRMSPVRRFFLLLCTFDILFTCLLWIISILVTGRDLTNELHRQVVEYSIHSY